MTGVFVCVHNAGRSPMAAGLLQHLAVIASKSVRPDTTRRPDQPGRGRGDGQIGIDITATRCSPREAVESSDVVITMGCGDAPAVLRGVLPRLEARRPGRTVRVVLHPRDDIAERVRGVDRQVGPGWQPLPPSSLARAPSGRILSNSGRAA